MEGKSVKSVYKFSGIILALAFSLQAENIRNTTLPMGDKSAEAFVALGGFYKALDIIEKEKSLGDKYADAIKEIKNVIFIDSEKKHPFLILADTSLSSIHKRITESSQAISREDIGSMIKKAIDDSLSLVSTARKDGKIKERK